MTPASDFPSIRPGESVEDYRARVQDYVGADFDRVVRHFEENNIELPSWLAAIAKLRNDAR